MKFIIFFLLLFSSAFTFGADVARSIITGLAPSEAHEHYTLISYGEYDEVKVDCSSFINHLYFNKGDQQLSYFLFQEECFYLAQSAFDAGKDGKPFCLEADKNNPPFKIFNDLSVCQN